MGVYEYNISWSNRISIMYKAFGSFSKFIHILKLSKFSKSIIEKGYHNLFKKDNLSRSIWMQQ